MRVLVDDVKRTKQWLEMFALNLHTRNGKKVEEKGALWATC